MNILNQLCSKLNLMISTELHSFGSLLIAAHFEIVPIAVRKIDSKIFVKIGEFFYGQFLA